MDRCTGSFPRKRSRLGLALLFSAIAALTTTIAFAQARPDKDPYQKISFKPAEACSVEAAGKVTYLVKNGVELSVTEDWDCDRVPDAYDNCVAMPNPTQADSDGNGIGDVCEAAATVKGKTTAAAAPKSKVPGSKETSRKAKSADRRQRASVKDKRDKTSREKPSPKRRRSVARR
jgi:hypothetical protein